MVKVNWGNTSSSPVLLHYTSVQHHRWHTHLILGWVRRRIKVVVPTSVSVAGKKSPVCDTIDEGAPLPPSVLNMIFLQVAIIIPTTFGMPHKTHIISWAHFGFGERRLLIPENALTNFLRLRLILLELDKHW